MIVIADYRAGNLASVRQAFAAVGAEARVVSDAADANQAKAIVVPGVGHFGATAALDDAWRRTIVAHLNGGGPLLGICLGMQWLFEASEEAPGCTGLGLLPGVCRRLAASVEPGGQRTKVPHVGWNSLETTRPSSALAGVASGSHVYFTHSYAAPVTSDCVAIARHGDAFAAVVERGSVWGVQFHPENSGSVGLAILRNFAEKATRG